MASLAEVLQQAGIEDDSSPMASPVRNSLSEAKQQVKERIGKAQFCGRYHDYPRALIDDYVLTTDSLGTGLNGAVRVGVSRHRPGTQVAVKHFELKDLTNDQLQVLKAEVMAFLCVDHPHIARLTDVYESSKVLSLVMECMDGGELSDRERYSEADAADVVRQIALALNYIHSQGIVHRDIKHGNVLFEKPGHNHVKLIDFGFTKFRDKLAKMRTLCGTSAYMAPEVIGSFGYTSKCDLWSLGVITFELLTGKMPYDSPPDPEDEEVSLDTTLLEHVSADAKDFTISLLNLDQEKRPSAADALKHPWFLPFFSQINSSGEKQRAQLRHDLTGFAEMPRARRICSLMAAWCLSQDERASVRDHFIAMDGRQEGTLVEEDLLRIFEGNCDHVFDALDASKTKEICYSEFLAAMIGTRLEPHNELITAAFHRFDTDTSGCITVEGLSKVVGDQLGGKPVEEVFREINGSSEAGVSLEVFTSFFRGEAEWANSRPPEPYENIMKPELQPRCCVSQ